MRLRNGKASVHGAESVKCTRVINERGRPGLVLYGFAARVDLKVIYSGILIKKSVPSELCFKW